MLTHDDVDVSGEELSRRGSVTLPANVQYAWPHAVVSRQGAGTVHVHPNGRFVYGVNRAETTTEVDASRSSSAAKIAS